MKFQSRWTVEPLGQTAIDGSARRAKERPLIRAAVDPRVTRAGDAALDWSASTGVANASRSATGLLKRTMEHVPVHDRRAMDCMIACCHAREAAEEQPMQKVTKDASRTCLPDTEEAARRAIGPFALRPMAGPGNTRPRRARFASVPSRPPSDVGPSSTTEAVSRHPCLGLDERTRGDSLSRAPEERSLY